MIYRLVLLQIQSLPVGYIKLNGYEDILSTTKVLLVIPLKTESPLPWLRAWSLVAVAF